jgi:hypothetical protein
MTKPTGRPRGRPKTKAYVTLMARVDITLADEVKRYASLHRQPISVVIRDALTLLMEEYPVAADRSGPHRLTAHEFLSDRYESPLDTLIGETDSAEVEVLLSDTNEAMVEAMLSDTSEGDEYASDTKEAMTDRVSDDNRDGAAARIGAPARKRSQKVSDKKAVDDNVSDTKEGKSSILSDTNGPAFDPSRHYLGNLCPRKHNYQGMGQSQRRKTNNNCIRCDTERTRERREAKREKS